MSDDNLPTKPLPIISDATEPITSDLTATAPVATVPAVTMPAQRPQWIATALIVAGFTLLLVLAVAVVPWILSPRGEPAPSATPTVEAPAPQPTVEAPEPAPATEAPVVPVPLPTEILPEPSEEPAEPSP